MKELLITRGSYAGRVLTLDDAVAESALADGWGRNPAEQPADPDPSAQADEPAAAPADPQSLLDFEAMLAAGGTSDQPLTAAAATDAEQPQPAARADEAPVSRDGFDQAIPEAKAVPIEAASDAPAAEPKPVEEGA